MAHTVESLRDLTGKRVGTSRWFTITQAMIDAHADIVEDHQFIHVDPEKAARTPFGRAQFERRRAPRSPRSIGGSWQELCPLRDGLRNWR